MAVGARFDGIDNPVVHSNLAAMSAQVVRYCVYRTLRILRSTCLNCAATQVNSDWFALKRGVITVRLPAHCIVALRQYYGTSCTNHVCKEA